MKVPVIQLPRISLILKFVKIEIKPAVDLETCIPKVMCEMEKLMREVSTPSDI